MALHQGPALRTGEHFFGRSLVIASRLADLARPDEILASAPVLSSIASPQACGGIRFGLVRWARLRGLRGVHRYHAVNWRPSRLPVELGYLNPITFAGAVAAWLEDVLVPALAARRD